MRSYSLYDFLVGFFTSDRVDPTSIDLSYFDRFSEHEKIRYSIIENLTNLDRIPRTRCQIIALPLKLRGCSGSPVRVVAVV